MPCQKKIQTLLFQVVREKYDQLLLGMISVDSYEGVKAQ